MATPTDRSTWRFWNAGAWQPGPSKAVVILPVQGGVSQTLSVDELAASDYVAVS